MSRQQYGQVGTVTGLVGVAGGGLGQPVRALQTPMGASESKAWVVSLQASRVPNPKLGNLTAIIRYGVGGVQLSKQVRINSTGLLKGTVVGSYVQVDLALESLGSADPGVCGVNVGAQEGGNPAGADSYFWQNLNTRSGNRQYLVTTNPGVFGQIHVKLITTTATPAAPLWLQFFDLSSLAGLSGTTPIINGSESDGLTGISGSGGDDTFSDELAPGPMGWSQGLVAALSSTSGTWTDPGAGNVMTLDVKAGQ